MQSLRETPGNSGAHIVGVPKLLLDPVQGAPRSSTAFASKNHWRKTTPQTPKVYYERGWRVDETGGGGRRTSDAHGQSGGSLQKNLVMYGSMRRICPMLKSYLVIFFRT